MPRPALRTRSRKRMDVPLPGGRTTKHYKKEKISKSRCSRCGRALHLPCLTSSEIRKLAGSERRVERIYGGQLCHTCVQELIKQSVRSA